MEFEKVITSRSSTKKFKPDAVSDELLQKILQAGRVAPTAKNVQPQTVYVLQSEKALTMVDEITPCRYGAPLCLLVCCDKSVSFQIEDYNSYCTDGSIVATHMMLQATALGVDNVWIRNFKNSKAKQVFNLPENLEPVMLLDLGYAADDYAGSPNKNNRKPLSETVKYL